MSLNEKQLKTEDKFDFAVGGQAVMEGVMMRSPHYIVVAVRNSDGQIVYKEEPYESIATRLHLSKIPVIRGLLGIFESMYIGMKSLNFSSAVYLDEKTDETKSFRQTFLEIFSLIFGLLTAIFLFKFAPLFITNFLSNIFPILKTSFYFNLLDGVIKFSFFLAYLIGISQMKDIFRLFQYHGAEHKSIMAYERNLPLSPENAKSCTRFHPRCGTSFIIIVILISILLYTVIPTHDTFVLKFIERLLVLPIIGGISYEALKYSAKHLDSTFIKIFVKPGLLFQRITTKEPDELQLEVGIASLKRALELEKAHKYLVN